jgi:hypothetical protein
MTWSLRIFNGDLVKSNDNSIDTVRGSDKVVQDLLCWIKEPFGTDPINPDLGSFIDIGSGGETFVINNKSVYIPEDFSEMVLSEIRRIITAYQARQNFRFRKEVSEYGDVVTFDEDEIIQSVVVDYIKDYDTLYITIDLRTIGGEIYSFSVPVQNDGIIKGA